MAVDLLHVPSRVRMIRADPLPEGVPLLLRIAAGDREATTEAARTSDRSLDVVQEAAEFFIEQILLWPEADSYRVLGASQQATSSELRHNMALLVKWLHPDMDRQGRQSVFVNRVTMAWDDLKTPERRAAYDEGRRALEARKPPRRHDGRTRRRSNKPAPRRDRGPQLGDGLLRRVVFFLLGRARH